MSKDYFGNTSVDDIRVSLHNMNPKTSDEIRRYLEYLNTSLDFEVKNKNRGTAIKLIRAKINKLKKQKPEAR